MSKVTRHLLLWPDGSRKALTGIKKPTLIVKVGFIQDRSDSLNQPLR